MIVHIINKDPICKLCMYTHGFEKFSFNVYFKMAASTGSHFENIKSQYLKNKNLIFMQFA